MNMQLSEKKYNRQKNEKCHMQIKIKCVFVF